MFVQAAPIDKKTAATIAANFISERILQANKDYTRSIGGLTEVKDKMGQNLLYVFDLLPQGYIIISASDVAYPIPAYSYQGTLDLQNLNPGTDLWLTSYRAQISEILNQGKTGARYPRHPAWDYYSTKTNVARGEYRSVDPMLSSLWDQGYPYNQMCPADPSGTAGHAVVGCVATACAQLMYYFRFPEHGSGSYSYYHPTYDTIQVDFSAATYEWSKMTDYTYTYNEEIAEISYHFGASVDMVYGPNSSGMYNHKAAYSLKTHFNYSPETQYVFRDSTNYDWDSLLISHLDRKIPMYYAGWAAVGSSSGHAFIADGYEITPQGNYYHFNWGWGGSQNGYFYTNNLTPGGSQFTFAQELIINAYPDTVNYTYPEYCGGPAILTGKTGTIDDGSGPTRNYENSTNCSWLIMPQFHPFDSISSILLNFDKMDTESGQDSIIIYDGPDELSPILGVFSGNNLPSTISTTGNTALIAFSSDAQNNADGFFISYEALAPEYCINLTTLSDPTGTVSDGSGAKYYNDNTLCRWLIEPDDAVSVTISFSSFDLQTNKDKLKVYDWGTQAMLGTFSGNQLPPTLTAHSGSMYLEFTSDAEIRSQGWAANYAASAAGIQTLSSQYVSVWPNPATDVLFWQSQNPSDQWIIELYDIQGHLISNEIKAGNQGSLSTSALEKGMYYLKMRSEKGVTTKRVIIL